MNQLEVNVLKDQMNEWLSPQVIDRGYDYYQRDRVKNIKIEDYWIKAVVPGNYGVYDVRVHPFEISKSDCNCPFDGLCKHIAALTYELIFASDKELQQWAGHSKTTLEKGFQGKAVDLADVLQQLEKSKLLSVMNRLMKEQPQMCDRIYLIMKDLDREQELENQAKDLQLYSAIAYYEKEVPKLLEECESLFEEVVEDEQRGYNDWRYNEWDEDEEEQCKWNYDGGVNKLLQWADGLKKLIVKQYFISGTVGLILTANKANEWAEKFEDDFGNRELSDRIDFLENEAREALQYVQQLREKEGDSPVFLQELTEWIVRSCKNVDEIMEWNWILNDCVKTSTDTHFLKSLIMKIDHQFIKSSTFMSERSRNVFAFWWISLCLDHDCQDEARRAYFDLNVYNVSIVRRFIEYYEEKREMDQVLAFLSQYIHNESTINLRNYGWIIRLFEKVGDSSSAVIWREKFFLNFPSKDTFNACLVNYVDGETKAAKVKEWIKCLGRQVEKTLIVDMLLSIQDIEGAWAIFIRLKKHFHLQQPEIETLFIAMEAHAPDKLIPIYVNHIKEGIEFKNRDSYQQAAKWMKAVKRIYIKTERGDDWTLYYQMIMTKYRGYRALHEELEKAGI